MWSIYITLSILLLVTTEARITLVLSLLQIKTLFTLYVENLCEACVWTSASCQDSAHLTSEPSMRSMCSITRKT